MGTVGNNTIRRIRLFPARTGRAILTAMASGGLVAALLAATAGTSVAAESTVGLGAASSFSVLGGTTVTNTGPSVLAGDLGVSPDTAVTGFPPGLVSGSIHSADGLALQAQLDLTVAYNDAAGRTTTASTGSELGNLNLVAGVYKASSSAGLTGALTLDAKGDPAATFIFQIGTTLTTASGSSVILTNGALACNVFWQVGSSATLGTNSEFIGTIMALESITLTTGATLSGRALARNGAVTLDSNTITAPACTSPTPTSTTTATGTVTPATTATGTVPAAATATGTVTPATTATGAVPPIIVSRSTRPGTAITSSHSTAVLGVPPSIGAGPGLDRGNNVGPPPLAETGPRAVLPLLVFGGLLLGAGGLLLVTARNHSGRIHGKR